MIQKEREKAIVKTVAHNNTEDYKMTIKANRLIKQIRKAKKMGEEIIANSGLTTDDMIYCFATAEVLVINCPDYQAIWQCEEKYIELRQAIAHLQSSIETIWLELGGKTYYEM